MCGPNPVLRGKQRTTRDDQSLKILAKQMQNYFSYRVIRSKTKDLTILIPILVFFFSSRKSDDEFNRKRQNVCYIRFCITRCVPPVRAKRNRWVLIEDIPRPIYIPRVILSTNIKQANKVALLVPTFSYVKD